MTARPSPIPKVPRYRCSVPGCRHDADAQWPGDTYRCDHHAFADIIDAPEPEVAGPEPSRIDGPAAMMKGSAIGMALGAGMMVLLVAIGETLAPSWAASGFGLGASVFLVGFAFFIGSLLWEAWS